MSLSLEVIETRLVEALAAMVPYTVHYKAASGERADELAERWFFVTSEILTKKDGSGRYVRTLEVAGPEDPDHEPGTVLKESVKRVLRDDEQRPILDENGKRQYYYETVEKERTLTVSGRITTLREGIHTL